MTGDVVLDQFVKVHSAERVGERLTLAGDTDDHLVIPIQRFIH